MDPSEKLCSEAWGECQLGNNPSKSFVAPKNHLYSQQHHRKREESFSLDCGLPSSKFCKPSEPSHPGSYNNPRIILDGCDRQTKEAPAGPNGWDPSSVLSNLSFLEQKIHQLQDLVSLIMGRDKQVDNLSDELVAQQQQLVNADLTAIVVQLISTAGSLLPSAKNSLLTNPILGQLQSIPGLGNPLNLSTNNASENHSNKGGNSHQRHADQQIEQMGSWELEQSYPGDKVEEHIPKDEEDVIEAENLPPGSYEVLQLEREEILAPHTHFCLICGKGFKRDANLRMHMRGHGDEYKTPAALAKPNKEPGAEPVLTKRYSCPYVGCKRNRDHKKFQPLKTILCVKNHYKRTHCDKSYVCSRCNNKRFSVLADLKTHEKHCGRDKWLCSCGTTFSRKDKLFGHVALFQGHTPALPAEETKGSWGASIGGESTGATKAGNAGFSFSTSFPSGSNAIDMKGGAYDPDPLAFFSSSDTDVCNFGGFQDFSRPTFDMSESSLASLISDSCDFNLNQKAGAELGSSAFG